MNEEKDHLLDTIPQGKFQIIQIARNRQMDLRIESLSKKITEVEAITEKEKTEQKEMLLKLEKLEDRLKLVSKIFFSLTSLFGSLVVSLVVWYLTKK